MSARTNMSATRVSIRALRRQERLTEEHAALEQTALSTAKALDIALSDEACKKYAVAQLARAHSFALAALFVSAPTTDAVDEFLASLATPTPGEPDDVRDNRI